jgi:hypothetical protein
VDKLLTHPQERRFIMGYGFSFTSRTKLADLAHKHAPSHADTESELALVLKAYEQHMLAEDRFFEFLRQNNEEQQ